MSAQDGCLTWDEAFNPKGCGAGTPGACHALTQGPVCDGQMACLHVVNTDLATITGSRLMWRANIDPSDNRPWCPFLILKNSKKADTY